MEREHQPWQRLEFRQGSPTVADVTMLTQYILTTYPASYLQHLDLSPNATSWQTSIGDVIIYVWNGDLNWLTDGDHDTRMALVTHVEPSGYPDVSEWSDVGEGGISPEDPWRGWTCSTMKNEWLQVEYPKMTAYVLHIDTSQPVTF